MRACTFVAFDMALAVESRDSTESSGEMNISLIFRPGQSPIPTIGGKGRNLLQLVELGQPVPPWFAVPAEVCPLSSDPLVGRQTILSQLLPIDLEQAVRAAYKPGSCVAVRSSAADENSVTQSFAGLHDSFLFVRDVDGLLEAIHKVWASAPTTAPLRIVKNKAWTCGGSP